MSADTAVLAEPTADELAAMVSAARTAHDAVGEAITEMRATTERARGARELERARAAELGRILSDARTRWPARGPRAKGWTSFLHEVGINARTAHRYIGYVDRVSDAFANASGMPAIEGRAGRLAIERLDVLLDKIFALFSTSEITDRPALAKRLDDRGLEIIRASCPEYVAACAVRLPEA